MTKTSLAHDHADKISKHIKIRKTPNNAINASTSKAGLRSLLTPSKKNSGSFVYYFSYSKMDAACINLAQI